MPSPTPSGRPQLDPAQIAPDALSKVATFHAETVERVSRAVADHPVLIVGMARNPHVANVKKALQAAGVAYEYLELGGYMSMWRERLAIKLWSGWPTFPQVFVKGVLVGGEDLTRKALEDGSLKARLSGS